MFCIVALLFSLSFSACASAQTDTSEIYQAVFSDFQLIGKKLYIQELVDNGDDEYFAKYTFDKKLNKHNLKHFGNQPVFLLPHDEFIKLFSNSCKRGWEAFHKKYPQADGLLTLSQVAYKNANTEAIVYLTWGSSCLGGAGYLIYLRKYDGSWHVEKNEREWVA